MYVLAERPEIVVLPPEPTIAPGLIVQLPTGKPLNITLPVGILQVGWVIVPTIGGVIVGDVMVVFTPAEEVQPPIVISMLL